MQRTHPCVVVPMRNEHTNVMGQRNCVIEKNGLENIQKEQS